MRQVPPATPGSDTAGAEGRRSRPCPGAGPAGCPSGPDPPRSSGAPEGPPGRRRRQSATGHRPKGCRRNAGSRRRNPGDTGQCGRSPDAGGTRGGVGPGGISHRRGVTAPGPAAPGHATRVRLVEWARPGLGRAAIRPRESPVLHSRGGGLPAETPAWTYGRQAPGKFGSNLDKKCRVRLPRLITLGPHEHEPCPKEPPPEPDGASRSGRRGRHRPGGD